MSSRRKAGDEERTVMLVHSLKDSLDHGSNPISSIASRNALSP